MDDWRLILDDWRVYTDSRGVKLAKITSMSRLEVATLTKMYVVYGFGLSVGSCRLVAIVAEPWSSCGDGGLGRRSTASMATRPRNKQRAELRCTSMRMQ